jgi:hypothetical protein
MNIHITYHAAQRFLQRVLNFTNFTNKEIRNAIELISKDIQYIHHRNKNFILPSFPNFNCIVKNNTIVTIIPKH